MEEEWKSGKVPFTYGKWNKIFTVQNLIFLREFLTLKIIVFQSGENWYKRSWCLGSWTIFSPLRPKVNLIFLNNADLKDLCKVIYIVCLRGEGTDISYSIKNPSQMSRGYFTGWRSCSIFVHPPTIFSFVLSSSTPNLTS